LDDLQIALIKTQQIVSWGCWNALRLEMKDTKIITIKYLMLFAFQNIISYNFRHCGYLHMGSHNNVVYLPFYSKTFINSIWSYAISFLVWLLLVCILLRREIDKTSGKKRLVLRKCGKYYPETHVSDSASIIANILVILFLYYSGVGAAVWIGVDNLRREAIGFLSVSHSSSINYAEYFIATIQAYLLPTIYWYSPFTIGSILSNALIIIDIIIAILSVLQAFFESKYCNWLNKQEN